jgi:hypothetical protein
MTKCRYGRSGREREIRSREETWRFVGPLLEKRGRECKWKITRKECQCESTSVNGQQGREWSRDGCEGSRSEHLILRSRQLGGQGRTQ